MTDVTFAPRLHSIAGVRVHGVDLRPDRAVEAACLAVLDHGERARAERFTVAQSRRQFVIVRGTLRLLLAPLVGRRAEALTFATGRHGKPLLEDADSKIAFNVSHTARRGLIAIGRMQVGVDIEWLGREANLELVARGVFTAAEQAVLQRRAGAERVLSFYRLWTQKEALIKAQGCGFAYPPREFALPEALLAGARSASFAFPGETATWQVTDLSEGAYAAALAHASP